MDPRLSLVTLGVADLESPGIAAIGGTILALCGLRPPEDYLPALVAPRRTP